LPIGLSGVTAFQNALAGIAWPAQKLAIVIAIIPADCDRLDVVEITPDAVTSWRLAHAARALQDGGLDWFAESLAAGYVIRSPRHRLFLSDPHRAAQPQLA
jgi:hypothetical protein